MLDSVEFTLKNVQVNWCPDPSDPEKFYPLEKYDSIDIVVNYHERPDGNSFVSVRSKTKLYHPNIDSDYCFCLGESYSKLIKESYENNDLDIVKNYVLIFLTYSGGASHFWRPVKVGHNYEIPICGEEYCNNLGVYEDGFCEECYNDSW